MTRPIHASKHLTTCNMLTCKPQQTDTDGFRKIFHSFPSQTEWDTVVPNLDTCTRYVYECLCIS